MRGWRAEKRKSYGSCLAARGRLPARHMRSCSEAVAHAICGRLRQRAPLSSNRRAQIGQRPIARRSRRQPAPGRTSYWVRGELRCRPGALLRKTRGRRTPSRLTTPRETPSTGRGGRSVRAIWRAGIVWELLTPLASSRRKPGSRADWAALDTGFRRYDGAWCGQPTGHLASGEVPHPDGQEREQETNFTAPCRPASAAPAAPDGPSYIGQGSAREFLLAKILESGFRSSRKRSNIIPRATATGRPSPLARRRRCRSSSG